MCVCVCVCVFVVSVFAQDLYLYLPQLVQALRYEEQSEEFLTLQASASHFGDDSDETSHMHMPDLEGHDDQGMHICFM